jgi:hypothetical protein
MAGHVRSISLNGTVNLQRSALATANTSRDGLADCHALSGLDGASLAVSSYHRHRPLEGRSYRERATGARADALA